MACPTCDHTMRLMVRDNSGTRYFNCPRCGTFRMVGGFSDGSFVVPTLVSRVQLLLELLPEHELAIARKLGIEEAVTATANPATGRQTPPVDFCEDVAATAGPQSIEESK